MNRLETNRVLTRALNKKIFLSFKLLGLFHDFSLLDTHTCFPMFIKPLFLLLSSLNWTLSEDDLSLGSWFCWPFHCVDCKLLLSKLDFAFVDVSIPFRGLSGSDLSTVYPLTYLFVTSSSISITCRFLSFLTAHDALCLCAGQNKWMSMSMRAATANKRHVTISYAPCSENQRIRRALNY